MMPGYRCIHDPDNYIIGHQYIESKCWPAQHYYLSKMILAHEHHTLDRSSFSILSASLSVFFLQRKFSLHFHVYFRECIFFCKFYSTGFYSKHLQIVFIQTSGILLSYLIIRSNSQKFVFTADLGNRSLL